MVSSFLLLGLVQHRPLIPLYHLHFTLNPALVVGQPLPAGVPVHCDLPYGYGGYGGPYDYCEAALSSNGSIAYVSVNMRDQIITDIDYDANFTLAGDLILAWGTPTTIEQHYGYTTLCWRDAYADAWSHYKPFTPNTAMNWVTFSSTGCGRGNPPNWQGFTNPP